MALPTGNISRPTISKPGSPSKPTIGGASPGKPTMPNRPTVGTAPGKPSGPADTSVKRPTIPPKQVAEEQEDVLEAEYSVEGGEVLPEETAGTADQEPMEEQKNPLAEASSHSGAVTAQSPVPNSMAAVIGNLEAMGFEGVDLSGFGAFPVVSLDSGSFVDTDGIDYGNWIIVAFTGGSRKKFLYTNGLAIDDKDNESFYSYDDLITLSGEPIEERLQEWRDKGWIPRRTPYVEVISVLVAPEPYDGRYVALNIPKTSIPKWSRFMAMDWFRAVAEKGGVAEDVYVNVTVGQRLEKDGKSWNPWAFDLNKQGQ